MKAKILFILLLALSNINSGFADDKEKAAGIWEGKLNIQGMKLRLVFYLEVKDNILTGTLDSPDQGAKGIPLGEAVLSGDSITIPVPSVNGYYRGLIYYDSLKMTGEWSQSGMSLPLELFKTEKAEEIKRPQTPKEPFPYKAEEVNFINDKEKFKLAGTLTIPEGKGPFPVVILVSGSGPQDRDETLMNHKPFWIIADRLSRSGVAVLRYDDRGIGQSEGDFTGATTKDFVTDLNSAVSYIRSREEFNESPLGVIGHSEGGLIAPMASVENDEIDFIILLAGPALTGEEILKLQSALIAKAEGASDEEVSRDLKFSESIYEVLRSDKDSAAAADELKNIYGEYFKSLPEEERQKLGDQNLIEQQYLMLLSNKWFKYFLTFDPAPVLSELDIPVLALYGEKDLQVPPKENVPAMENALKNNDSEKTKVMVLPGLNHLFQKAESGSPTEYGNIEETFSEDAIKIMDEWIKGLE